ncbi:MAG: SWIM zinc finger family protein [Gemmataceae bacterium]
MTTEQTPPQLEQQSEGTERTPIELAYAGPSTVETEVDKAQVTLLGNLKRPDVQFEAKLKHPLRFREAMSALYQIVGSDFRYTPKDRTAYTAYLRMKKESAGLQAWQAQQQYFTWLLQNDPLAFLILDPIITVHPDQVFFEVFSKDEGTYAKLAIDCNAFEIKGEPQHGTTNIDYSQTLYESIQQMRSYRETKFLIGREAVRMKTTGKDEVLEKQINVPDSWLRGFLQVQSAATLPTERFSLKPVDIYNLLRHLRLNADIKGKRRGLRVELVPNEHPRLVLEPWEVVISSSAEKYKGRMARIVRIWGRRRLMLLRRLLPYVENVDVHVLGSGLPSFWTFKSGEFTLTFGITGFTSSNWSQAINFDLLLPRKTQTSAPTEKIIKHLQKVWLADKKELSDATGLKGAKLVEALQNGCQQGHLIYDLANDTYRYRPLTDQPLDLEKLEYRNSREKSAYDLIVRRDAVQITSENRIAGTGLELTGQVTVEEDRRDYRPQLLLSDEGQVYKAECTCSLFRKQGLKDGPCIHLIALRLAFAHLEQKRAKSAEAREAITVETRSYSRRDDDGEDVVQLSLERQRLKVRWGRAGQPMRLQALRYNSEGEAREAYFARIEELNSTGYLDATAG